MINFFAKHKFILIFVFILLISIKIYSLYFTNLAFGDEYDNFTYSWLFRQGILPYRDVFSHEYPLCAFLGLPLEFIGHSQANYRLFILLVTFVFFSFFTFYLKGIWRLSILIFMLFSSFAINFYGGQQFEDGSFLAIFLISSFLIVAFKEGQLLKQGELVFFSVLFWLTLFSSPIFATPFLVLLGYHLLFQIRKKISFRQSAKNLLPSLFYFLVPTLFFLLYLIITSSLRDFYFDAIIYNQQIYFYYLYQSSANIKILGFFVHSAFDVVNHFFEIIKIQGPYLITFIKSAKFFIWPFNLNSSYTSYINIVFKQFYDNFFTFETFIALFYLTGITALIVRRKFSLAILSIIFTMFLRLRIQTRLHMAPFYLFSYWLLSVAIASYLENIYIKKKVIFSLLMIGFLGILLILFVIKNWYDFEQASYNRFPKENANTIKLLSKNTNPDDKILVLRDFSSSYYYDSQRIPHGIFINYFPWYNASDKLRNLWLFNLQSYRGNFLILDNKVWFKYCSKGEYQEWFKPILDIIKSSYVIQSYSTNDLIFRRRQNDEQIIECEIESSIH